MKRAVVCVLVLLLCAVAWAMPLGSSARTAIPSDIQQIISVDYRALKNSETAQALKAQVLPESLKQFEGALKSVGIDPEKDVEQLTFASYRAGKQGVRVVGLAQGQFPTAAVLKKMRLQKVRPMKYHELNTYPMPGGMQMAFLDDDTLLFGDLGARHDWRRGLRHGLECSRSAGYAKYAALGTRRRCRPGGL